MSAVQFKKERKYKSGKEGEVNKTDTSAGETMKGNGAEKRMMRTVDGKDQTRMSG